MRKVRLENLTPDMRLGKSIYHYNSLLLREGTTNLTKFLPNLMNLGIPFLYIDDELSEDIEIEDAVSEGTRFKCRAALHESFQTIKSQGSADLNMLSDAISLLLDDILSSPDILISLSDIGTTDDSTLVHSVNTTIFSLMIAQQLNFSMLELKKLAEGALLHDIGKTLLKPEILYKTTPISAEEFSHIKEHSLLGYTILRKNPNFTELSRIISLQHHERLDGSGYPYGLKKEDIHVFAKIVAIADMYDALTAERCYRAGLSNFDAYQILMKDSQKKIDHELLKLFLQHIAIYPNGTVVKLSDGTRGIVKSQNKGLPFCPLIRVINDLHGEPVKLYDLNLEKELNITIIN